MWRAQIIVRGGHAEALVVLAGAAGVAQPQERPLYCLPSRQHVAEAVPLERQAAPIERARAAAMRGFGYAARLDVSLHQTAQFVDLFLQDGQVQTSCSSRRESSHDGRTPFPRNH